MQTELAQQILDEIRSIKQVSLIEGRDCVWDDLAQMYASAQKEIRIWGEGADLSDPSTEKDILRLGDQTKKILADRKIVTRIQTVDTWSSWLDFQRKLREEYRGTYLLYFTDQQLKFVPQLNIKDRDEVSLVSPEQQRELTYSTRIRKLDSGGSQAIQKHLNDFESLQGRSIRLDNPRHLRRFAEALRKVKRWQT
ncbi:hypothetical protein KA005_07015, partial [bacterium]|nr:hypothetical protein [bacterium]